MNHPKVLYLLLSLLFISFSCNKRSILNELDPESCSSSIKAMHDNEQWSPYSATATFSKVDNSYTISGSDLNLHLRINFNYDDISDGEKTNRFDATLDKYIGGDVHSGTEKKITGFIKIHGIDTDNNIISGEFETNFSTTKITNGEFCLKF
jgi:hypothetical protein